MKAYSWVKSCIAVFATMALITGCSSNDDSVDTANETSEVSTSSAAATTSEEETSTEVEEAAACGTLSAEEAYAQNIGQVPVFSAPWSPSPATTDNYDPCADLSGMLAWQTGGSSNAAQQLLLFHKGEFIGSAEEPLSRPVLSRVDDATLKVETYNTPSFNTPETPLETYTYKWDSERNALIFSIGDTSASASSDTANTASGAVTPYTTGIPAAAQPMTVSKYLSYRGNVDVIQTPSENIGCWGDQQEWMCRVISRGGDPQSPDSVDNWIKITNGVAQTGMASDVPSFIAIDNEPKAQVVPYGTTVTNGRFVCLSEEKGLTCWDSQTGAGGFLSRETLTVQN